MLYAQCSSQAHTSYGEYIMFLWMCSFMQVQFMSDFLDNHVVSGSFTRWKKWYPSCYQVWKWPPFLRQNTDFSAQNDPFYMIKHWLFCPKWTPLFEVKHWLLSPNEPPFLTLKHWTSKLTPSSPNSRMWVPKYLLFLGKCESWISSKKISLFMNFRTRIHVVK